MNVILLNVLIFTCLTKAALSITYSSPIKDIHIQECRKELNVSNDDTEFLRTKNLPENENQSCLMDCVYGKLGLIKDGKLDSKDGYKIIAQMKFGDEKEKSSKKEKKFEKCSQEETNSSNEKCGIIKNLKICMTSLKIKDR